MKPLFCLLLALLLGNQLIQAQDSQRKDSFLEKIVAQYNSYFDKAEFTEKGQLCLSGLDNYFMLSIENKNEIMEDIASNWKDALIIVHGASNNELWGKNSVNEKTILIEKWDMNPTVPITEPTAEPQRFIKHPWFFYIGEQGMMDSNKNLAMALNTRLGFFLLLNRWDLAATFSANFMGNENSDDLTGTTNLGLMSKVYFPIKEYNISPHLGAGISVTAQSDSQNNTTRTINNSMLLGISWFVGFGSLDIGVNTGKQSATLIGFTIFPSMLNKKK